MYLWRDRDGGSCTNYHSENPHAGGTGRNWIMDHSLKSLLSVKHCEATKAVKKFLHCTGLHVRI